MLKHIFSETIRPIELKFYLKSTYDRLANICTNCSGHMTKMATTPIYGKKAEIIMLVRNVKSNETMVKI